MVWASRKRPYSFEIIDVGDHAIWEHRTEHAVEHRCSCGWRISQTRRQNAWARVAIMKSYLRKHVEKIADDEFGP